jgi:hypothetical protein
MKGILISSASGNNCSTNLDSDPSSELTGRRPRNDTSHKGKEFVLMRGNDGKWNRFGR